VTVTVPRTAPRIHHHGVLLQGADEAWSNMMHIVDIGAVHDTLPKLGGASL